MQFHNHQQALAPNGHMYRVKMLRVKVLQQGILHHMCLLKTIQNEKDDPDH